MAAQSDGERARAAVAHEAARIICETGLTDYRAAKSKAAEHLPAEAGWGLPRNLEIREAVLAYQRVFGGPAFTQRLRELRETARDVMRELADFRPRLVGGVLSGAIGLEPAAHDIQLHVFADAVEELDVFLINHRIEFATDAVRLQVRRGTFAEVPICEFGYRGIPVVATIFSERAGKHAPISSVDDAPIKRAALKDVEALLAQPDDVSGP